MIVDNYADIAQRMRQLQVRAPQLVLLDGMLIVTESFDTVANRKLLNAPDWVFVLADERLRLVKSRDDRRAMDFVDFFQRYVPSAQAITQSVIRLSPEDFRLMVYLVNQLSRV